MLFAAKHRTPSFMAGILVLAAGCADGYDSPSGFDLGVYNTQMETPVQDSITFKVSTDGETATVSWPLVAGADGHEVTFVNVDDPDNPVVIDGYDKKIVDGSSFTVSVAEDSKYQMTMRTLGNKSLGNKDDQESHTYNFSTLVPSVMTIPDGVCINEYIAQHGLDVVNSEVAIDLVANGQYTLTDTVDFGGHDLTFRGDKVHRPVVTVKERGSFATWSGLKFKFINFDMTEAQCNSFLYMSKRAPDSILVQNLPNYVGSKIQSNTYMVEPPIYIAHCWFKNLPQCMLHDNKMTCAFWYFTVSDCIVQMKNDKGGNIGFICMYEGSGPGGRSVKNITIENSTIYNIVDNNQACFIRYSNESNSAPNKCYGEYNADYNSHTWVFKNSTFSRCYTGWRFVNNVSGNNRTVTIDHCIFYNVAQLYRINEKKGTRSYRFNFYWNDTESYRRDLRETDSSNAPFASEYDPMFGGDNAANVSSELDFSQPNGGVNFAPTEYQIVSNRGGDPRWLDSSDADTQQ